MLTNLSSITLLTILLIFPTHQTIKLRNHNNLIINQKCCLQNKGAICGVFDKDCCDSQGCKYQIFLFKEVCKGKIMKPNCSSCDKVCKDKGGVFCNGGISGKFNQRVCCKKDQCGTKGVAGVGGATCKHPIDTKGCVEQSLAETIFKK